MVYNNHTVPYFIAFDYFRTRPALYLQFHSPPCFLVTLFLCGWQTSLEVHYLCLPHTHVTWELGKQSCCPNPPCLVRQLDSQDLMEIQPWFATVCPEYIAEALRDKFPQWKQFCQISTSGRMFTMARFILSYRPTLASTVWCLGVNTAYVHVVNFELWSVFDMFLWNFFYFIFFMLKGILGHFGKCTFTGSKRSWVKSLCVL